MKRAFIALFFFFILSFALDAAQKKPAQKPNPIADIESDQKMETSSFCGYAKGKKAWEVKFNSADIFGDIVKIAGVTANVYGEEEDINLVSDKGTYDKSTGKMHLENNVVITTQTGGKLTTDSLDWYNQERKVTTDDIVNIEKQNIKAVARGLEGEPNLKKVYLKDKVKVEVKEQSQMLDQPNSKSASNEPTIITCDGPLEIDYEHETATFNNNVKVDQKEQGLMYADKMTAHFDFKNKKILYIKSSGNVKIVKGENTSYSDEAVYSASDKKMILTGRPRLVIRSEEKLIDAPSGN